MSDTGSCLGAKSASWDGGALASRQTPVSLEATAKQTAKLQLAKQTAKHSQTAKQPMSLEATAIPRSSAGSQASWALQLAKQTAKQSQTAKQPMSLEATAMPSISGYSPASWALQLANRQPNSLRQPNFQTQVTATNSNSFRQPPEAVAV